jgi:hypothetical protein
LIRQQQEADSGERKWAFDEPERVALEAARAKPGPAVTGLIRTRTAPGRQVFEWTHGRSWTTVVVIRPYWLSYFAKATDVAWVMTQMKTASCDVLIRPGGDIKAQVNEAFEQAFGPPLVDARLPPTTLAGRGAGSSSGPRAATFFEINNSYAVTVDYDERGWPALVDVRPKTRYPAPSSVWQLSHTDLDAYVPMDGDMYASLIVFFDSVRPLGAKVGPARTEGELRVQDYLHARLSWDDASAGGQSAIGAFQVTWSAAVRWVHEARSDTQR